MTFKLKTLLDTQQNLKQLSGKLQRLRTIQSAYELIAPTSLKHASHVMNVDNGLLTLAANNGTVAAKLRQMTPDLLERLKLHGCEVTGIQVKVQVTLPRPARHKSPATLGPKGKQQLDTLADTLLDSPLKTALQRFTRNSRNR